jgi:hypothetical protein
MLRRDLVISRRTGVETRTTPKGAILVDMTTGRCFQLNRVGSEVWALLESPATLDVISKRIADRYQRSRETVENEICSLAEDLLREQLVTQYS